MALSPEDQEKFLGDTWSSLNELEVRTEYLTAMESRGWTSDQVLEAYDQRPSLTEDPNVSK